MRTTIIRLEAHDDVFSTCDRMDWGNTGRILLVWPDGPTIIQRRLDLTLLQRHAQKLGAHLALACEDQEIRLRAIELGIPIFRSAAEAQRKPWRIPKARRRMSFEWLSEKAFGSLPQKAMETGAVIWRDVLLLHAGSPGIANSDLHNLLRETADCNPPERVLEKLDRIIEERKELKCEFRNKRAEEKLWHICEEMVSIAGSAGPRT